MIKPILFVKNEIPVFVWFCEEFNRIYWANRQKENINDPSDGPSDKDDILEIMFLHLILECLVTYYMRQLVNFFKSKALFKIWNRKEEEVLLQKIRFIEDLSDPSDDFKKFSDFAKKSNNNRNKIVHGHEYSEEWGSNHHFKASPLNEIICNYDSDAYVREFKACVDAFLKVGKKIAAINIATDRFQNFIDVADNIEKEFKKTFLSKAKELIN